MELILKTNTNAMNYTTVSMLRDEVSNLSFRLVRPESVRDEEGLPTSGNDNNKTTKYLNPEAKLRGILLIKKMQGGADV